MPARLADAARELQDPKTPFDCVQKLVDEHSWFEFGKDAQSFPERVIRVIVERLRLWAEQQKALPRSALAEAIGYLLNNWNGLTAFLDDPLIPLDNNRTERALRGMVLGRKNHYGSRSVRGTQVAAISYTLIETCILCGVDPEAYLRFTVRSALRYPGTAILPHEFAREHRLAGERPGD
mgnify:CR=1 FL=1